MKHFYPKLRPVVDVHSIVHQGQQAFLLSDPLQLAEKSLVIPTPLHYVLALCDGSCEDAEALSSALVARYGLAVPSEIVSQLLDALNNALLLDNSTFALACNSALEHYRSAPHRPLLLADGAYPADVFELRRYLEAFLEQVEDSEPPSSVLRGLVTPHIDYERGGLTYARVWRQAVEVARTADLVVILGTDHYGPPGTFTLTRQNYATPFGVLPTAQDAVDMVAGALGEARAFAGELRHRSEHSIELAAVWLHHIREGRPCELLPILCGSFSDFLHDRVDPAQTSGVQAVVQTLRALALSRRVLVVAAADMAHVGVAFDGDVVDEGARALVRSADRALLEHMSHGDAGAFWDAIVNVENRYNVCGVSSIYVTLRALAPLVGSTVSYDLCPADEERNSWVSICGMLFE